MSHALVDVGSPSELAKTRGAQPRWVWRLVRVLLHFRGWIATSAGMRSIPSLIPSSAYEQTIRALEFLRAEEKRTTKTKVCVGSYHLDSRRDLRRIAGRKQ